MQESAQSFWLDHLTSANQYNRWIVSQLLPYLGDEILEVGCGVGTFTAQLAPRCSHLTAIDSNAAYIQRAATRLQHYSNVELCVADATQMAWSRSFDTIILLDVLEHIAADVQLLRHLCDGLKPDGTLMVKVPALSWLYSPLDEAIGHYRRYTKSGLATTFQQAGFSDPKVWYFNAAGIPGWWLNGRVLQRTTPPAEQIGWFDRLVPLLASLESRVSLPFGLSLFAVAQSVATKS